MYSTYRVLRGVMRTAPLIMAVSMLFIGLAAIGRPRALLTGWGGPLIIGGIIGMIIAVALGLAGNLIAESLVRELTVTRPAGMYQALVGMVRSVSNRFTLYTSLSGLVVAVIGAGLFLFGRFYWGRPEEEEMEMEEAYLPYGQEYPAGYPQDYHEDYGPDYPLEYPVQFPAENPEGYEPRYPDEAPTIYPEEPLDPYPEDGSPRNPWEAPTLYPEEPLEPYSGDERTIDPDEPRRSYPDDAPTRYPNDKPERYPGRPEDGENEE
jgi:hypothetical protein